MRSYSTLATFGQSARTGAAWRSCVGLIGARRCAVRQPGAVLRLAVVLAGRRAVRQPAARLRGVLDHAAWDISRTPISSRRSGARSAMRSYTSTVELGLRVSQQLYLDAFYDAGNLWERPSDFDPTRLFRGAGFGASLVTPLGPLGVDLGYGFDRTDVLRSQGSQVAGPLQVRSDLLIRSSHAFHVRATTLALVLTVVASVAQAQAARSRSRTSTRRR